MVWESILKEDFVSSYREILDRIYYSEFENALHSWSQNYACEMEMEILLCKDQILIANYEDVMKNVEIYEADIVEKCKTILVSDEKEFMKYYFVTHSERLIFNNWKTQSEDHFKNTRLHCKIQMKEKLSHLCKIAERNHKLFNDFYGKRDVILKKATETKLKLLSDKSKIKDLDLFEEYFENEWQNWISDFKLSEHEIPCVNFILLLKKEIENLTSVLQVNNEGMEKIKSFYKCFEETNYSLDVFVVGKNHYRMFEQNGLEIHTAHKYHNWLDYALRKDQKDSFTDFPENKHLIKKVSDLIISISEASDNFTREKINLKFSGVYLVHIIKIIFDKIEEFNNKEKNDRTIEIRVRIEKEFIYELALFLCAKLIFKFKNKRKPNQMDSLKTQIKSQFKYYYNIENYSSLACANGLANVLLEKMNFYVGEELQFLVINKFSDSNTFSVSSKCHLQTKVLTYLANESSFDKYWKYIHEPNQAMKDWIIKKFQIFCKRDSSINSMNACYKKCICIMIGIYSEALQQSLMPTTPVKESTLNDKVIENSNINSNWKAQFHKKLEGEHTRQFKLTDLDVLLIEPHEITNPSEFVSFFADSLQKQSDSYNLTSWVETYIMTEISTTFSNTICRNFFNCNEHCPLCNEPCLSNINSPDHKHYCGSFHRPLGLNGWFKLDSNEFIGYDCTNLKDKDASTYKHKTLKFNICKQISESWDNSSKHYMIESVYWEWVMCKFKDELADHYQYKINEKAIKAWSNLTKSQVLNDLQRQMNDFHSPALMWRTKEKLKHIFSFQSY